MVQYLWYGPVYGMAWCSIWYGVVGYGIVFMVWSSIWYAWYNICYGVVRYGIVFLVQSSILYGAVGYGTVFMVWSSILYGVVGYCKYLWYGPVYCMVWQRQKIQNIYRTTPPPPVNIQNVCGPPKFFKIFCTPLFQINPPPWP